MGTSGKVIALWAAVTLSGIFVLALSLSGQSFAQANYGFSTVLGCFSRLNTYSSNNNSQD